MQKVKVAVLGATGNVGQRFVQLLETHPWFDLVAVCASEKSAGKTYGEAVEGRWPYDTPVPAAAAKLIVQPCEPTIDCKIVFSGLDADVAGDIESSFANAGYFVFSNAKNHRMDRNVPLLIPEVNADHAWLAKAQKRKGFIVTNPNCTTVGMVLALAPLHKAFGITSVMMTSMQAISGAGYQSPVRDAIVDNVIPFIGGEEEKVESETLKLLGTFAGESIQPAAIKVSAQCNRVNVIDGHTETVAVTLEKKVSVEEIKKALSEFNPLADLNLPSSPQTPIIVTDEKDRPQAKLDRDAGKGMSITVGRVRPDAIFDFKFVVLSHNTIRGAAGGSILNAELMHAKGLLEGR